MRERKGHWQQSISVVFLVLLLAAINPVSAMTVYAKSTSEAQKSRVKLETIEIRCGNTRQIALPQEVPQTSRITYQSKDEKIAAVIYGVVVAYAPGRTNIFITAEHEGNVWEFEQPVVVSLSSFVLKAYTNNSYLIDMPRVMLQTNSMTVAKGKTARFRAIVGNGCFTKISFRSSNSHIVKAEQEGAYCKVTGVGIGEANITVTYMIGTQKQERVMKVTVTQPNIPISSPKSKKIGRATEWKGDYVYFGHFEQDNDLSNGSEMILWRVLQVTEDSVLLLSNSCLAAMPYHEIFEEASWENSDIRTWLNNDFKQRAFTGAEAEALKRNTVVTKTNPFEEGDNTITTQDYVYLLSSEEVSNAAYGFHPSAGVSAVSRKVMLTEYAKANDGFSSDEGYSCWWLRDNGISQHFGAYVLTGGKVTYQYFVGRRNDGVRPVICLALDKISFAVPEEGYPVVVVD